MPRPKNQLHIFMIEGERTNERKKEELNFCQATTSSEGIFTKIDFYLKLYQLF